MIWTRRCWRSRHYPWRGTKPSPPEPTVHPGATCCISRSRIGRTFVRPGLNDDHLPTKARGLTWRHRSGHAVGGASNPDTRSRLPSIPPEKSCTISLSNTSVVAARWTEKALNSSRKMSRQVVLRALSSRFSRTRFRPLAPRLACLRSGSGTVSKGKFSGRGNAICYHDFLPVPDGRSAVVMRRGRIALANISASCVSSTS